MDNTIILASSSRAMTARDILKRKGINSRVVRIPPSKNRGCGFGLKIFNNFSAAVEILESRGISEFKSFPEVNNDLS